MPTSKTKTARVKQKRSAVIRRGASGKRAPSHLIQDEKASFVTQGDRTTHVLLPIKEYERLLLAEMAQEAAAVLDEASTEWVDFDEWALQEGGRRIAAARKAKGLTQTQLGKKLGIAQAQISRIERNPDGTLLRTLKRIARALGVDVRQLLG